MSIFVAPQRFLVLLGAVLMLSLSAMAPAHAETLLRVERDGALINEFDRATLAAMQQITFTTSTIWTEGEIEFTGISLRTLLAESGITSGTVRAIALNDYAVEMPVAELSAQAPIIAHLMNGEPFSRRDKGPLWIVYPYDSAPEFRSETAFGRSVWQLTRLSAN